MSTSVDLLWLANAELEARIGLPLSPELVRARARLTRAMARVARARGRLLVGMSHELRRRLVPAPPVSGVRCR